MSGPRVAVIGGGLAGLTAALRCADGGALVTLLESRPQLGGATRSFRRDGLWVDNGQHVFLRCCTAYRGLLRRLGVEELTEMPRLSVPVLAPGRDGGAPTATVLRRLPLPAPLHLAGSLAGYAHLTGRQRLATARGALALRRLDLGNTRLDDYSFGQWLAGLHQPRPAIDAFWDLITLPTVNVHAKDASLAMAAMVFQTGFLRSADGADIGWSQVPLDALHAGPARAELDAVGAEVRLECPVRAIEGTGPFQVATRAGTLDVDAVVVAVPHREAARLLPDGAGIDRAGLAGLGCSPIVNVHVRYDRAVTDLPMAAVVGSPVQFVFDRTGSSGARDGQYIVVSLSAANAWLHASTATIGAAILPALAQLFPRAATARVVSCFATREPAATFRAAPGTARLRPGARTALAGLYLAGAWTDTGWPATMEGAVRSGLAAADALLAAAPARQREAAEATEVATVPAAWPNADIGQDGGPRRPAWLPAWLPTLRRPGRPARPRPPTPVRDHTGWSHRQVWPEGSDEPAGPPATGPVDPDPAGRPRPAAGARPAPTTGSATDSLEVSA